MPQGDARRVGGVLAERRRARDDRHPRRGHDLAGADLVAERLHRVGRRPDEHEPGVPTGARERGVLGEESVAGVDRLGPGRLRRLEDPVDAEVRLGRGRGADPVRLVRVADVERLAVGVRVDRDRADPQLVAAADDAHRDLAPVGDQDLAERRAGSGLRGEGGRSFAGRRSPRSLRGEFRRRASLGLARPRRPARRASAAGRAHSQRDVPVLARRVVVALPVAGA